MRAVEIVDDRDELICHAEAAWTVDAGPAAHWFGRLRKVDDGHALYEALSTMKPLKIRDGPGGEGHGIIVKSLAGATNDEASFVGSGPPPRSAKG
ncbi:MAG: hypothetical protein ACE5FA_12240 [Dehalococcoidia bacterium]